jgi:hypothetical protein
VQTTAIIGVKKGFREDGIDGGNPPYAVGDVYGGQVNVKHQEELSLIQEEGISIIRIVDKLQEISSKRSTREKGYPVVAAAGSDLIDLMFAHTQLNVV